MDQQNTRVILAVVLSMAVLLGWSFFFSPERPAPAPEQAQAPAAQQSAPGAAPSPSLLDETPLEVPAEAPAALQAAQGRDITVETPLYKAVVNSAGGVLKSFELKEYRDDIIPGAPPVDLIGNRAAAMGPMGLLVNGRATWRQGEWSQGAGDEGGILSINAGQNATLTFEGEFAGVRMQRSITLSGDSYLIGENLKLANVSETQLSVRVAHSTASPLLTAKDDTYNKTRVVWSTNEGKDDEGDLDDLAEGLAEQLPTTWAGVRSNYFLNAAVPGEQAAVFKTKFESGVLRAVLERTPVDLLPGTDADLTASYYYGPILKEALADAPGSLSDVLSYGWFDLISKPLMTSLNFIYNYVGNYGIAIIILTVIIKLAFWPLSQKSYKSMNEMKKIQPLMAKVREQYKDDRQKMNEEMIRLYKTYKVNPAGGCLPMILQIPVFIGLYQALLNAIELRHAPFIAQLPFTDLFWLADLSTKDPFYITPIVMGGSMFLQQLMTPSPGDPMQAKLMLLMPVVFTFVFINFPAGLVVYWLVNNILSIAQQWLMLKKA